MVNSNPFGNYTNPTPFPMRGAADPQGLAGDALAFRSPAQDWANLRAGMDPFWQERMPMRDLASNLTGRYYL